MENESVYKIAARCGGEIYVGVVGPVRTGKSTFIKKFMENLVIPFSDGAKRQRMTDELPQSASGKTVMTTEPKFIPEEAAQINVKDAVVKIRLIDCVGFPVEGASGFEEDGQPRLVKTPWSETPVPFERAAEEGTQKVIRDHSCIAVLVTCDGSVTDIGRNAYTQAEERAVQELKDIAKPFVIVLNSKNPQNARDLQTELQEKYGVPVLSMNVEEASAEELSFVLERILYEFPVLRVDFDMPDWTRVLDVDSPIVSEALGGIREIAPKICKMSDCALLDGLFQNSKLLKAMSSFSLDPATGRATAKIEAQDGAFYAALSEECGEEITGDYSLMRYVSSLKEAKKLYERAGKAFEDARQYGYGIVPPEEGDMTLSEPKLVKKSGRVGVDLQADAPSYHVIRVDLKGNVSPALGNEEQSEAFVKEISSYLESEPERAWNTNMFGKTLKEMLSDELYLKNRTMGETVQKKMRKTVTRIVNEGKGGVICILL